MANLYVEYNGLVMGPKDDPSGKCGGGCTIRTPFVSRSERWEYVGGILGGFWRIFGGMLGRSLECICRCLINV